MKKRKVYYDHNATTPMRERRFAMAPLFSEIFGNASSVHTFGQEAKKHLEDARETVAKVCWLPPSPRDNFHGCGSPSRITLL